MVSFDTSGFLNAKCGGMPIFFTRYTMAADPEKHNYLAIANEVLGASSTEGHHHIAHTIPDIMVPFGAKQHHHMLRKFWFDHYQLHRWCPFHASSSVSSSFHLVTPCDNPNKYGDSTRTCVWCCWRVSLTANATIDWSERRNNIIFFIILLLFDTACYAYWIEQ